MFHGEEGKQLRRTIEKDLRVFFFANVQKREEKLEALFSSPGLFPGCVPRWEDPGSSHKIIRVKVEQ